MLEAGALQTPSMSKYPIEPGYEMGFEGDALVVGRGTKLGTATRRLARGLNDQPAFDEPRAAALLAIATGLPTEPIQIAHLRAALRLHAQGEAAQAWMHVVLSHPKLTNPEHEAAWRVAEADRLMAGGMRPIELLKALGFSANPVGAVEQSYDPDQPRVPKGNGRPSGQWTKEETGGGPTEQPSEPDSHDDTPPDGDTQTPVQVAGASDDWSQYINPISDAEAEENDSRPFSGAAPNDQHSAAVSRAVEYYRLLGYSIVTESAAYVDISGFASPRVYDFIVRDPISSQYIGVEVKTTFFDTIFLNRSQVDQDVALYEGNFGKMRGTGYLITEVAYEAFCAHAPR